MDLDTLRIIVALIVSALLTLNVVTVCTFLIQREARVRAACAAVLAVYALSYVASFVAYYQTRATLTQVFASLQAIPYADIDESLFSSLRIRDYQCRLKFVCETSKLFHSKNGGLASFLELTVAFGGFNGDYISGLLVGITGQNCSQLYSTCEHSPLMKTFPFLLDEL